MPLGEPRRRSTVTIRHLLVARGAWAIAAEHWLGGPRSHLCHALVADSCHNNARSSQDFARGPQAPAEPATDASLSPVTDHHSTNCLHSRPSRRVGSNAHSRLTN